MGILGLITGEAFGGLFTAINEDAAGTDARVPDICIRLCADVAMEEWTV